MFTAVLASRRSFIRARGPLGRAFFTVIRTSPPIYFHESTSSPRHKVSLSPDPNALPIGYTPHLPDDGFIPVTPSEAADFSSDSDAKQVDQVIPKPQSFLDEPAFIKLLREVGAENIHKSTLYNSIAEGEVFREGTTLHVYDMRDPPPYGRIPLVQDIVGMVRIQAPQVEKGISPIIPNSFEYNPMYRPLSMKGFINVGDFMNDKLRKACEAAGSSK